MTTIKLMQEILNRRCYKDTYAVHGFIVDTWLDGLL